MKKIFVIISVLFIFLNPFGLIYSQSWKFLGGPTGRTINDVIFTNSGRILCSDDQSVYYSDNYGLTWKESISARRFSGIHSFTLRTNGEIIAIASYNIIKSTDNGINWFVTSNHSYLHYYGTRIYESPTDSALYFVKDKSLYKSTDGGFIWNIIWNSNDVIDCMTIDERGWILMSERYKRILISKNNGDTFTHFPFSMNISNSIIGGIFSDGNGGYYFSIDDKSFHYYYAIIKNIADPFSSRILAIDEQGNAIFRLGNVLYIYLLSIKQYYPLSAPDFMSSSFLKRIVVKGHNWIANVSKFGIYYSKNSGREWVDLKIGLGFVQATTMYITKNSKILVSAFSGDFWGNLYFSNDNGVNWFRHNPPQNPVFFDINKAPNDNLVAIGSYGIFVSSNEGSNWTNPVDSDIGSKVFVSKKGYIYCATYPNGLFISTNNGITWFKPNTYNNLYFVSFNESSSGRLFAASVQWYNETKLYYSDDNGLNWIRHNQHFSKIYDFLVKGDSIFLADFSGIYLSIDNGQSWDLLNYQFISKMMLAPNGDFIAISFGRERLLKSTNNGKDWFYWDEEIKNKKIVDLRFDYENRLYALTDSGIFVNDYYIKVKNLEPADNSEHLPYLVKLSCEKFQSAVFYKFELYSDSVSSLTKKEYQSRDNIIYIESLLPNKIYYWRVAVHSERLGVFYSDFRKFKTFPELTVFANYPNPFNVATTVQFSLPFKTKIKISVFNSLGEILEVVADDEFSHGIHSVEWNADKYSSGIYLINVRSDYFSKNLKAILIK